MTTVDWENRMRYAICICIVALGLTAELLAKSLPIANRTIYRITAHHASRPAAATLGPRGGAGMDGACDAPGRSIQDAAQALRLGFDDHNCLFEW